MNNYKNKILFMITFMSLCASSFSSQAMYNDREDRSRSTGKTPMNDIRDPYTGKMVKGTRESEIIKAISNNQPIPKPSSEQKSRGK